jgi:CheY-like chemotaxis protein
MPRSVLVVDDDHSVRVSLVRALRARGYQAVGAGGGEEALRRALESPPDVIVMDLMMPLRSGAEVARAMRRERALAHVPIIALSASPWLVSHPNPLFVSVLTKPCRVSHLIDAITQAVQG